MTKMQAKGTSSSKRVTTRWNWSLGGSLIASLCCVGPAVAALIGVGSASFLLGLARYRVPLLLVGLVIAGVGTVQALRVSRRTCSPREYRRNQWLVPSITLVTFAATYGVLTYVFPTVVYRWLSPASALSTEPVTQQQESPSLQIQSPAGSTPIPAATVQMAAPAEPPTPAASPAESKTEAPAAATTGLRRATLAISGMT